MTARRLDRYTGRQIAHAVEALMAVLVIGSVAGLAVAAKAIDRAHRRARKATP